MAPPLHPAVREYLQQLERDGLRPYENLTVLRARAVVNGASRQQGERTPVGRVSEVLADGVDGRLPVRIYHPAPGETRPLLVYLHGGGFVAGSVSVADRPCRALADASGWVVASVEYRLAPENPHPAPIRDCVAATRWLVAHAGEFGSTGSDFAVLGDSAGGALAAGLAIAFRDAGEPLPAAQLLVYPTVTPTGQADFGSLAEFARGFGMTREALTWFWEQLLSGRNRAAEPSAAPLQVADLTGLPPATVVVAECDPLRDEGLAYAARLVEAGVPVATRVVPGVIHGFWWMDAMLPQAGELTTYLAGVLHDLAG